MSGDEHSIGSVVALLSLPEMGPVRLRSLLGAHDPEEAWQLVSSGRLDVTGLELRGDAVRLAQRWRAGARGLDPVELWHRHHDAGIRIIRLGQPDYPLALADDLEPPELLFVAGQIDAVVGPSVAVIGTRRCTSYGARTARLFGEGLAATGVSVVSGLALGIDAAAHLGALSAEGGARPVAVVGTGLDVVYPARNRELWRSVAERGVVISESPMGTRANAWRFPARNRIIAALSRVVVVVESRASGGSLHTAREAMARDRDVLAVPGPIHAPESAGTNGLLFDGWGPARSVDDIVSLLGLSAGAGPGSSSGADRDIAPDELAGGGSEPPPGERARHVLDQLGSDLLRLDDLVGRTGLDLATVAMEIQRLVAADWVRAVGARFERCR